MKKTIAYEIFWVIALMYGFGFGLMMSVDFLCNHKILLFFTGAFIYFFGVVRGVVGLTNILFAKVIKTKEFFKSRRWGE